ncbi:MAG: hypothetical protein JNM72_15305 [Deltaproteobacteria bacterium]|nr:hypothetical protein [Deltaproteobacteria bacterium]
MKRTIFVALLLLCGPALAEDPPAAPPAAPPAGPPPSAAPPSAAPPSVAPAAPLRALEAADLGCLQGWAQVGRTRIGSLTGQVDAAVAVAQGGPGLRYPPGTVVQLMPTEAMVKLAPGASPATDDWEFLKIKVKRGETRIVERGGAELRNLAGSCAGCHVGAKAYDHVCMADHGCKPLPDFIIKAALAAVADDPRCAAPPAR